MAVFLSTISLTVDQLKLKTTFKKINTYMQIPVSSTNTSAFCSFCSLFKKIYNHTSKPSNKLAKWQPKASKFPGKYYL